MDFVNFDSYWYFSSNSWWYRIIRFFYFKKSIDEKTLKQMSKRTYGKNEEGEFIRLKLIDFKKLLNVFDSASVIIGHSLIRNYEIL